jgi:hypothetical protein
VSQLYKTNPQIATIRTKFKNIKLFWNSPKNSHSHFAIKIRPIIGAISHALQLEQKLTSTCSKIRGSSRISGVCSLLEAEGKTKIEFCLIGLFLRDMLFLTMLSEIGKKG